MSPASTIALILAGAMIAAPVAGVEPRGLVIHVTPDQAAACAAEGGCVVASQMWLMEQVQTAYKAGVDTCGVRVRL